MGANWNHILLSSFTLLIFYLSLCSSNEIKCTNKPKDSCVCHLTNGSFINLKTVGLQSKPKFENNKAQPNDNYTYSYNPCYSFMEGPSPKSGCSTGVGVAACQAKAVSNDYFDIGVQSSATFFEEGSHILIQYTSEKLTPPRITNVTLICSENTFLKVLGEKSPNSAHYEMELYSPCACLNSCGVKKPDEGLSTGSILVILLFTFILFYLVGGIIYQKIIRGATGYELIPNLGFWLEFPLLVRDGCIFCKNGCDTNPRTTYDTI